MKFRLLLLGSLILLCGCPQSDTGIEGQLSFNGEALRRARVEFYLKSGEERSSAPFSVVTTDEQGQFHTLLPPGDYYLVAKKKEQGAGVNRMLMAEYPQNPVVVKDALVKTLPLELREVGMADAIVSDGKTRVSGTLHFQGDPLSDAFIYVYTRGNAVTGPSYGLVARSEKDGSFELPLLPGRYWLAARKRSDGSRVGDPQVGDLSSLYSGNPISLTAGEEKTLQPWALDRVTQAKREKRMATGKFVKTSTWLSGRVVNAEGQPVSGIYVFAYRDSRMIGKPNFISAQTQADGKFQLYLDKGGEYFIGARSAYGGPLEPGEWVGTFDKRADHGIVVMADQQTELGEILVQEVW